MAPDKSNQQDPSQSEPQAAHPQGTGDNRPIFTFTMDPTALEHEINQASQALNSNMNALFNSVQSSVFGGFEALSKEMSTLERSGREFFEPGGHLQRYHQQFSDGLKKRYRITIEELPPLDEDMSSSDKALGSSSSGDDSSTFSTTTVIKGKHHGDDLTISRGKAGTPDEGKTVITTSVAPGLLDWLLFTTYDDSFFTRLGLPRAGTDDDYRGSSTIAQDGAKIRELNEAEAKTAKAGQPLKEDQEGHSKRMVPSLVEKVKQVGTSWEKDARHWWQQRRHGDSQNGEAWPRGEQNWGHTESYSQTTVTRPDGTVEHRTVNNLNGEIETTIKIRHPDGSMEETVTRENRRRYESDEDRKRDSVAAVVAEAMATERLAAREKEQQPQAQQEKSRSWPPKAWIRRQERDD